MLAEITRVVIYDTEGKIAQKWDNKAIGNFSLNITKPGEIRFEFAQEKPILKGIADALSLKKKGKSKSKSASRIVILSVKSQ